MLAKMGWKKKCPASFSFTTYLRGYSEQRGLDKPQNLGRIWRIALEGVKPYARVDLKNETSVQLVAHLTKPNNWWRETAQRLLEELATDAGSNDALVAALSRCIMASRKVPEIERLVALAASSKKSAAVLDGALSASLRKPVKLAAKPAALRQIADARAAKFSALLVWPGKPGMKPEPPLAPLTQEQQARYEMGRVLFTGVCAACHQPHGKGLDGVAPPLMDSEWVLGPEQRLVRIVLHGLTGPLSVKGKTYYLDMPAFGSLPDEQISAVLTYLRREWEHTAAPVEPGTVKAIRAATADRHEAWLQDLLREIR